MLATAAIKVSTALALGAMSESASHDATVTALWPVAVYVLTDPSRLAIPVASIAVERRPQEPRPNPTTISQRRPPAPVKRVWCPFAFEPG